MIRKNGLNPHEVGARIREIRGDKTLGEFGSLLGVKNPTVYRYENDRVPDGETLLAIAVLDPLKRGVEWLLTGQVGKLYKEGAIEAGRWAEAPEDYGDAKRLRLVREVKDLVRNPATPPDIIEALLANVAAFKKWRR